MQQTIRCGASSPALPPFGPAHFHQQASSVLLPRWDAGVTFPSDAPSERKGQLPHSDDLRASFPICHRKLKERWRGWARSPLITFCPCPHPQGQLYCATVDKRLGQLSHLPQVASVGKQRAFFSTPHHHISHSHNTVSGKAYPPPHTPHSLHQQGQHYCAAQASYGAFSPKFCSQWKAGLSLLLWYPKDYEEQGWACPPHLYHYMTDM